MNIFDDARPRQSRIRWMTVALVLPLFLPSCVRSPGGQPPGPVSSTFLMMGTESLFSPLRRPGSVALKLFSSASGGQSWSPVAGPNGPCPAPIPTNNLVSANCARADIAPALASSGPEYVAAWWGQVNTDGRLGAPDSRCIRDGSILFVAAHRPAAARGWTAAALADCRASGNLDERSRPAIAFLGSRNQWFAAFRDATGGVIHVIALPVPGANSAIGEIRVPPVSATTAVAMTSLSNNVLVLTVGTAGALASFTSTDGAAFVATAAPTLDGVTPIPTGSVAPYLAPGGMLAIARQRSGLLNDIQAASTRDGANWTSFYTSPTLGGNWGGPALYTPAAAGVAGGTTFVVAYPGTGNEARTTIVYTEGQTRRVVPLNASEGVALAFGPAPALDPAP